METNSETISITHFYHDPLRARCTVDGIDAEGFALEPGYGSSYITVQNCYFHDTSNNYFINFVNSGHNIVKNCHFHNSAVTAVYVTGQAPYNQFIGCEFDNQRNQDIYLDGGSGTVGSNIVTGCSFHDHYYNAGLHIKCNNNKIYNNTFYNFLVAGTVGLSIYSEYSPSYANDNEIYNNTFTDMLEAFWVGHNPANYPTLRNKIHDNTFTRVTSGIRLNPWEGAVNTTE
ncbi:right-handed parallel beta-helix repeat-containing protein, partial [Candidatus Bathyarchaeota archaeon]|nr:right-handed parallel beta-helix repeat-containing protein [Candidatus Bathyarchaeota archaeon]